MKSSLEIKVLKAGRVSVSIIDRVINFIVIIAILLALIFGIYSLWDTSQVYNRAKANRFEIYKPMEDTLGFEELQEINSDVFAWLTVYGTSIDYPVVQADDNKQYLNSSVLGEFSLAGSIFLDYENRKDFTDFNSIIYGHHMEEEAMFGELYKFMGREFFDSHRYGNLFFENKNHGVEFFAFVSTTAHDGFLYSAGIEKDKTRQRYLDYIFSKAVRERDLDISINDNIVLLSTCTTDVTNGREILVGRITDEVFEDTFITKDADIDTIRGVDLISLMNTLSEIPYWGWILIFILLLLLATLIDFLINRIRKKKVFENINNEKLQE